MILEPRVPRSHQTKSWGSALKASVFSFVFTRTLWQTVLLRELCANLFYFGLDEALMLQYPSQGHRFLHMRPRTEPTTIARAITWQSVPVAPKFLTTSIHDHKCTCTHASTVDGHELNHGHRWLELWIIFCLKYGCREADKAHVKGNCLWSPQDGSTSH